MKKNEWFDEYGYLAKPIPSEAVDACSHSGSCDADVKYWVKELKFEVPDLDAARKFVKSTGAFDDRDMMDEDDMNEFVFWEFCNRIREEEYEHENHPDDEDEDDDFEAWAFCSLDC